MAVKATPLGIYCAVEPHDQGEGVISKYGIFLPPTVSKRDVWFLNGTVLKIGKDVKGVKPGDKVVYEVGSGHPGQTWKINAEIFGGTEGSYAVLIPCRNKALESVSDDDEEASRRTEKLALLDKAKEGGLLDKEQREEYTLHTAHLNRLQLRRQGRAKGRRITQKVFDNAGAQGIVAVVNKNGGGDAS